MFQRTILRVICRTPFGSKRRYTRIRVRMNADLISAQICIKICVNQRYCCGRTRRQCKFTIWNRTSPRSRLLFPVACFGMRRRMQRPRGNSTRLKGLWLGKTFLSRTLWGRMNFFLRNFLEKRARYGFVQAFSPLLNRQLRLMYHVLNAEGRDAHSARELDLLKSWAQGWSSRMF